jgi:hypothetical protein
LIALWRRNPYHDSGSGAGDSQAPTRKEGGGDFLGDMSEMWNVEARTRITGFALVVGVHIEAVVLAQ